MEFETFKSLVQQAANLLRAECPHGDPLEEDVVKVTESVGLPVTFGNHSLVFDPVRRAVFETAFRPEYLTRGAGIDRLIQNSFECMNLLTREVGASVPA